MLVRHQNRIYRFLLALVPNYSEADDLLQQTLLTLWEKRGDYDAEQNFLAWSFGIARNHARNHVRKNMRRGDVLLEDQHMDRLAQWHTDDAGQHAERQQALEQCLESLKPDHRSLVSEYYDGTSASRLAKQRRLSVDAVYKVLQRSRKLLFDCIRRKLATEAHG